MEHTNKLKWMLAILIVFSLHQSIHAQFVEQTPLINSRVFQSLDKNTTAKWIDYDNDDDLDLFNMRIALDGTTIYKNTNNTFTSTLTSLGFHISSIGIPDALNSSAKWSDMNNDGLIDIILMAGGDISPPQYLNQIAVYKNNGDDTFTLMTSNASFGTFTSFKAASLDVGDFNNDGLPDIVHMANEYDGNYEDSRTTFFINNGDFTFIEVYTSQVMGLGSGDVKFADVDNDGLLDVIIAGATHDLNYDFFATKHLKVYKNTGIGFTEIFSENTIDYYFSYISTGDFNSDGYIDYLVQGGQHTGNATLYQNNNGTTFSPITSGIPQRGAGYSEFVDYDMDGDLDIFLEGIENPTYSEQFGYDAVRAALLENSANTFTTQDLFPPRYNFLYLGQDAWGDYDNDGKMDVVIVGLTNANDTEPLKNTFPNTNTAPSSPSGLSSTVLGNEITLS